MPPTDLLKSLGLYRNPFIDRTAEKTDIDPLCVILTPRIQHGCNHGQTPHMLSMFIHSCKFHAHHAGPCISIVTCVASSPMKQHMSSLGAAAAARPPFACRQVVHAWSRTPTHHVVTRCTLAPSTGLHAHDSAMSAAMRVSVCVCVCVRSPSDGGGVQAG